MSGRPPLVDDGALPDWLRPMADVARTIDSPRFLSPSMPDAPSSARPSAVLVLFGEGEGGPDILLTERARTLRSHAGQIAFPGGASDPGDDGPVSTALREAVEEVGLDPAGVDPFATLPRLWLPPSNFAVTPVLAWWREPTAVRPVDRAEVESVFRSSVADLTDPANRFSVSHPSGFVGPGFTVGDDLILWGFTAGIVSRLIAAAGWDRPWDEHRTVPFPGSARGDRSAYEQAEDDPLFEEIADDAARDAARDSDARRGR